MQKCPLVQSAFLSGFWTDLHHQYGIFGGESQTSLFPFRSSLRDVNERRLYSQASCYGNVNHHRHVIDTGKFSLINFRKSHEIW